MNLKEKRAALMAQLKEKQANLNDGTATVNGGMLETMAFNAGNASNII